MRWWGWLFVIVLLWWIINNPHTASTDVHNVGSFISGVLPHSG